MKVILCSFIIYISDDCMESARLLLLTETLKTHRTSILLFWGRFSRALFLVWFFFFLNEAHI